MRNQFIAQFVVLSLHRLVGRRVVLMEEHFFARQSRFTWLSNVNYASFLAEIWPEGIRKVDLSRCRVIKWIVAPFHENLPNLSNDPRTFRNYMNIIKIENLRFVVSCFNIRALFLRGFNNWIMYIICFLEYLKH